MGNPQSGVIASEFRSTASLLHTSGKFFQTVAQAPSAERSLLRLLAGMCSRPLKLATFTHVKARARLGIKYARGFFAGYSVGCSNPQPPREKGQA